MVQEDRLDPHYFSTTPRSSWELFKWIFTEPIKLDKFDDSLSRIDSFFLSFKTYIWIFLFSFILFTVSTFLIAFFDIPNLYFWFFNNEIQNSWENHISIYDKFLFLLEMEKKTMNIYMLIYLFILFIISYILQFAKSVYLGTNFILVLLFSLSIIFGYISSSISFINFVGNYDVHILSIIFNYMIGFIISIFFLLFYYFIFLKLYFYIYYFVSNFFVNINLRNNLYLNSGYISFSILHLEKKIADDSFFRPYLSADFMFFLFEFRPYQRKLAFYLANTFHASILYHYTLSSDYIEIPKNYEKNQPTENFTNTLKILKDELEKYQIQTNIHNKVASLKEVIKILKNLEQQMLIEKRGWSEYYLKAIRANLNEANARLENLELEAKKHEPITANIYETGNPLSPNYQNQLFKGRKDLIDRLSNIIYTSQQIPLLLIQGQRRVGKTSLINYLEQLLGSGFKIVKIDMQSPSNKEFNLLIQNINQKLNEKLGIDETIEINDNTLYTWIAFENYLIKYTKELNYKIIIAFDEYEAFHKNIVKKHKDDILANMRSFIQSQNQVIFLFAGMLRISDLTSPNWDEYFPQAQRLKVDYLSKEESYELITHPVDDFNLVYSDDVADEVYRWTMGHPQLLQTICSNIVTIANQTNQKRVNKEMVEKAKDEVFEVNEMPMTIFWREFCGDAEREVIEQILANQTITQESKEQRRALARLVDYGFIMRLFGAEASDSVQYRIFVPLFKKWLIERRDLIEIGNN
jgi:Holliday junction resolvasome RuvABC ATP-dependent DNA helicase subunit